MKDLTSFTVALSALASPLAAQTLIPDEVTCSRCTLTMREIASLGTTDGPGMLVGIPHAVRVDGAGRYWVVRWDEAPVVFDAAGAPLSVVGRRGQGPGEYVGIMDVVPLPGDSMLILDSRAGRATVVGPDLRATRTIAMPPEVRTGLVVEWPGRVILNVADYNTPGLRPLHRVMFSGAAARLEHSFGGGGEPVVPGSDLLADVLAPARGDAFWSSDATEYRITRWSGAGEPLGSFLRKPSWFAERSAGGLGNPATPPSPRVRSIEAESDSLLWVVVHVPTRDWKSAWPRNLLSGVTEVRMADIALERLYAASVEALDVRTGRVLVRQHLEMFVIAILPLRRIAVYSPLADGTPRVSILRLEIERR